jgi:hypothetical protein
MNYCCFPLPVPPATPIISIKWFLNIEYGAKNRNLKGDIGYWVIRISFLFFLRM